MQNIGNQIGIYHLLSLLGQGSSAQVYLGRHIHLGTMAAIKIFYESGATWKVYEGEKIRAEVLVLCGLHHPHIVKILDFAIEGFPGVLSSYIAMSYAQNGTLRQRYPVGMPMPLHEIVTYVSQVADALQYAHTQSIVHGDVKPENILIEKEGHILLSDFGIASVWHNTIQTSGRVRGTVTYMAPESLQGKSEPASDQYALGAVVYEWLSGSPPFTGMPGQIVLDHMNTPVPPLMAEFRFIPKEIEQIVMKTLSKDPKQRYPTVKEFALALEHAGGKNPASGPIPSILSRPSHTPSEGYPVVLIPEHAPLATPGPFDFKMEEARRKERSLTAPSIPKTPLQAYKEYVKFCITSYARKASTLRLIHNVLQGTILAGAAFVSITITVPQIPKWLPAVISGIVTIATSIATYYKFGERSRDLHRSAEDIQQEYNWFKSERGPYKHLDEKEAFTTLQDRIEVLRREQVLRSFAFEEQKEVQK